MEQILTQEQLISLRGYVGKTSFNGITCIDILNHIDNQQACITELDGLLTSASDHCNTTANERNDLLCNVAVLKQQQDRLLQALKHIVGCDNIVDAIALAKQAIYTTKEK